jgi:tetratricopeptide (TPR) repeat protein
MAAQTPAPTTAPPAPAGATESRPVSDPIPPGPGRVTWATSLEEARLRASEGDKLVFLEFVKKECGNCERMDNLLYPAADLEAMLSTMVPIKVDLESPMGKEFSDRYGFAEAPSILITTPEGRLVFLMEGFHNQAEFFRHAYSGVDGYRKFAKRVESQDIAKLPMKEALETGTELYRRSDPETALPRLRRAVAAPGGSSTEREDALELLAAVEFELGQPAVSRKTIERLIASTKDRERRERAELFRAQIPLAENRPAEALALFRKFQTDHPQSSRIAQVNELVDKLEERVPRP